MREAAGLITDAVSYGRRIWPTKASALTANVVMLIRPTKSWIQSGYVRHETELRSQAVFLQMPLVVFKRTRDVGVLKDIENPIIRKNVVARELVVGRDVPTPKDRFGCTASALRRSPRAFGNR